MNKTIPETKGYLLSRSNKPIEFLLGVIVLAELIAPFLREPYGFDAHLHLLWIRLFSDMNRSGILVPTWLSKDFFGFGSVAFYFYPPFTYYIGSFMGLITSLTDAGILFWLIGLIGTVGSFFSARWLLKKLSVSNYLSAVGGIIYAFAPLRVFDLFNRAAISTHVAYVFLPLICGAILVILRQARAPSLYRILLLSVSSALLALTSVPITFATLIVVLIALIVNWRLLSIQALQEFGLSGVITAGLVAYHFTSVLSSKPLLRLSGFRFPHHASDIYLWFHPGSGTYELLLTYITIGTLAVVAIVSWRRKSSLSNIESLTLRTGLSISAFVFFLDFSPLSASAWNHIAALQYIQFPWRFYPVLLLFGVVIITTATSPLIQKGAKIVFFTWSLGAIVPCFLAISGIFYHPIAPMEDDLYAPISNVDQVLLTAERHKNDPQAMGMNSSIPAHEINLYREEYSFNERKNDTVTFHRFYWPFWHLYANGREIPSYPDSIGRAVAVLPAGNYTATWQLERTPLEQAGLWISGVAWSGVIIFAGIGFVRRRVRNSESAS